MQSDARARDAKIHDELICDKDSRGVDVLESRAREGGRRAGGASDRDEFEGVGEGASSPAGQHG